MEIFDTLREAAAHLRRRTVGARCGLTKGGKKNRAVELAFHRYGLRTNVTGKPGNRTVELTHPYEEALEKARRADQSAYWEGDKTDDPSPRDSYAAGLKVGESVVRKGKAKTIRTNVTSKYGPWTCTVHKVGEDLYEVTRISEKPNPDLFPRTRGSQ